jgi:hypothetical protein
MGIFDGKGRLTVAGRVIGKQEKNARGDVRADEAHPPAWASALHLIGTAHKILSENLIHRSSGFSLTRSNSAQAKPQSSGFIFAPKTTDDSRSGRTPKHLLMTPIDEI